MWITCRHETWWIAASSDGLIHGPAQTDDPDRGVEIKCLYSQSKTAALKRLPGSWNLLPLEEWSDAPKTKPQVLLQSPRSVLHKNVAPR